MKIIGMVHLQGKNDEEYEEYKRNLPKDNSPKVNRNDWFAGRDGYFK